MKPSIKPMTKNALQANNTLLIGRQIKIHFSNHGGSWGKMVSYDVDKDLYILEFAVDSCVHCMTFENVLKFIPNSWFGKQVAQCSSSSCRLHFGSWLVQHMLHVILVSEINQCTLVRFFQKPSQNRLTKRRMQGDGIKVLEAIYGQGNYMHGA